MKFRQIAGLCLACLLSGAGNTAPLMNVEPRIPNLILDIRYFSSYNFVGTPIDGYSAAKCLLTAEATTALAAVQKSAQQQGLTLKIFDCYRPQQAVDHFVRWAKDLKDTKMKETFYPAVAKSELFTKGYIAEKSGHSRGSTLDLTLVSLDPDSAEIGELDMGTDYDFFDPLSHTDNPSITGPEQEHRQMLKKLMSDHGFKNLPEEWWHYSLENEPYPETYFNVPVE